MKTIVLKRNSFFTFLYQFVYRKELPNGLCPFFWANLFALIVFLPFAVWCLPTVIVKLFDKDYKTDSFIKNWVREWEDETANLLGLSFALWFGLFLLYMYAYGVYFLIAGLGATFAKETGIFWFINAVLVIIAIALWWTEWGGKQLWAKFRRNSRLRKARAWRNSITEDMREPSDDDDLLSMYKYRDKVETTNWFIVCLRAIVAFYDKNCPRIEWK